MVSAMRLRGASTLAFFLAKNLPSKNRISGVGYMIERADKTIPKENIVLVRIGLRGNSAE
jgi:hypothetical protein